MAAKGVRLNLNQGGKFLTEVASPVKATLPFFQSFGIYQKKKTKGTIYMSPFEKHHDMNAMRNGITNALLILGRKSGKFERQIKKELLTALGYNSFDEFLNNEINVPGLRI